MSSRIYNAQNVPIFAPNGFPEHLGLNGKYDSAEFEDGVKRFQKKMYMKPDGFCGPATIKAMASDTGILPRGNGLLIGPKFHSVGSPTLTYENDFTLGETSSRIRKGKPTQIIIHYDVSFNARATNKILLKRGYSTHFIIDGDAQGTIFQCHDPATKVSFHAGASNDYSIGIDLNNPADVSFLARDVRNRKRERDTLTETIHGHRIQRLGYFPEQIQSLKTLLKLLCETFDIPLACPRDAEGSPLKGVLMGHKSFRGIVGHYHLTTRKTDPSPLDWDDVCPHSS